MNVNKLLFRLDYCDLYRTKLLNKHERFSLRSAKIGCQVSDPLQESYIYHHFGNFSTICFSALLCVTLFSQGERKISTLQ